MKRFALLLILGSIFSTISAQKIEVVAHQTALSEILISLRDKHDFQFSYNNDLLSNYLITINKSFSSKEKTIEYLLKNLPLNYEMSNGVF